jgi:hypothetical protein
MVLGQDQWPPGILAQVTTVNRWGRDQGDTGMSADTPQQQQPYWPGQPPPQKPYWPQLPPPWKKHRAVLWAFLAIQVMFLSWVIYSAVSAPQNGLGLQIGLWAVTFVITCAVLLISQLPRSRVSRHHRPEA